MYRIFYTYYAPYMLYTIHCFCKVPPNQQLQPWPVSTEWRAHVSMSPGHGRTP